MLSPQNTRKLFMTSLILLSISIFSVLWVLFKPQPIPKVIPSENPYIEQRLKKLEESTKNLIFEDSILALKNIALQKSIDGLQVQKQKLEIQYIQKNEEINNLPATSLSKEFDFIFAKNRIQ